MDLPILSTQDLLLRLPDEKDASAVISYYRENEARFTLSSPKRPDGFLTEVYWVDFAQKAKTEFKEEKSLTLLLFDRAHESEVIGTIAFSQMCRGAFQACYLGYTLGERYEGKGFMTEALQAAISYVFGVLNYHRIMANHHPENVRSARVLQRLGFSVEGHAKDYLYLAGAWRDHVLTSLSNPNWKANH